MSKVHLEKIKSQIGIINFYLFKEVLANFGACLFIFTFTILMSQVFKLTEMVINKGFGLLETVKFIFYLIPALLTFVIPMSLLLGILITLGRMSADGEIIAFKASGFSLSQIFRPVLVVSVIAYFITNLFTLYISPKANYSLKKLIFTVAKTKAEVGIKERIFNSDFEGLMVYINKIPSQGKLLEGVLISDTRQSEEPATIIAEQGYLIPNPQALELLLQLKNGSIHRLNKKKNTYQKIDFKTYNLNLQYSLSEKSRGEKKRKEMTIPELLELADKIQNKKEYYLILVDLHSRIAIPFACLVFGLLGVPLGIHSPRAGKSYGFIISLIVILIYYIFFSIGKNLGRLGIIHPFISMWIPNLFFLFFSSYLFKKAKTESSIFVIEKLAWYLEIIKTKFHYFIEGSKPEETDYFSALLDINTASQEELMLKLGIGEKRAASIIAYRETHGGIKYLEELKKIRGIGEKTFMKIKENILS